MNPTMSTTLLLLIGAVNGASVVDEDGFVLIERHLDVANGYFSADVLTTGLENEDDPSANTYCIIGGLDSSDYLQSDGYYDLKLIYKYSDGTEDVLEWTQTSWITEATITGADLTQIEDVYAGTYNWAFNGLGEASNGHNYLDGSGSSHGWWHAVASSTAITVDGVAGITGHQRRMAYSSALWIRPVEIPLVYRGNIVNGEGTTCSGTDCLAECEGDCDSDFHCEEGLVCWHRDGVDIPIPPGCTGDAEAAHTDYCYNPAKKEQNDEGKWPYVHRGHNHDAREGPLQECEGECDNDDNCAAGLQCFHRDDNEVPGCDGQTHGSGDRTGGAGFDYCYDPSLNVNAAAHSMSVEGENGAEHDSAQQPVDDMNPIALTLIGAVVVVVIALLFVMMRGSTKKEQTAKETVAEMSEVVDAPKVVHVADDTVEVPTETAVPEPSMPETTVNGMEEAVEVKVNTESV